MTSWTDLIAREIHNPSKLWRSMAKILLHDKISAHSTDALLDFSIKKK
jgi:hypothetical protein